MTPLGVVLETDSLQACNGPEYPVLWNKPLLFCLQSEALHVNDSQILVYALQVLGNSHVLVPDVLLRKQARFLQELVQTTLSDVLNHSLVQVSGLLLSGLSDNLLSTSYVPAVIQPLAMLLSM